MRSSIIVAFLLWGSVSVAATTPGKEVQDRVDADIEGGRPIVAHVVVALCDNIHQGIVPVPQSLGNGQHPGSNLYWGAAYGIRSYFKRQPRYTLLAAQWPKNRRILDGAVFHSRVNRKGREIDFFIVAEAWDGKEMAAALKHFLRLSAGHDPIRIKAKGIADSISAGGNAAVIVFVGHNGLMDLPPPIRPREKPGAPARSAIVLACASRTYFLDLLRTAGAHPLLLTTGLMAPEAYSLEAALFSFVIGQPPFRIEMAAASAYHHYQKCGRQAALRLFSFEP